MREIKFRLRFGKKIVGYERWFYGDSEEAGFDGYWMYSENNKRWFGNPIRGIPISHTHKDQFTGLCDKKGQEIYERDIAKDEHGRTFEIYWHIETASFWAKLIDKEIKTYRMATNFAVEMDLEVVGNVFQNKDLMEKKK